MMSENGGGRQTGESAFIPLLLLAVAFLVLMLHQSLQLASEREHLRLTFENQNKALQEARMVRGQLDSLAAGMSRLAVQGNKNAQALVAELKQRGVTINPDPRPEGK